MRRRYRIAVIEGDPLMRALAERWLGDAGHKVVPLSAKELNPAMALDLIMADVANLRAAAERVKSLAQVHPAPVLLVSGRLRRTDAPSPALAAQLGAAAVLPKPYTQEQLLAAVAAALAIAPT